MPKPENPPFFPQQTKQVQWATELPDGKLEIHPAGEPLFTGGATLRDWFAGMALQGMWAGKFIYQKPGENETPPVAASKETIAAWVYEQADAMLAERNKDNA